MREDDVGVFLLGAIVGFVIVVVVVVNLNSLAWKEEAIQHKAAHYDQITGEFKWNDVIHEAK
mgnify:CR=1 FL=1